MGYVLLLMILANLKVQINDSKRRKIELNPIMFMMS